MNEKQKRTLENAAAFLRGLVQKKNALFFLGLAGILLIFLSDALFAPRQNTSDAAAQPGPQTGQIGQTGQTGQRSQTEQELEARLAEMIGAVQGAGKVRVMLTLENDGETVYACDEQSDTQTITGTGGADGVTERRQSYETEHVLIDAGNTKQPLVETCLEPEVKGVAVVCEGGDDITVVKRVTELVSVVLRLPTNRVCVIKMTDTEDAS